MTAARIGPAHGAHTNPSAAPTPSPDQKPSPRVFGPKRASRESGAWTRCAEPGDQHHQPERDQHDDRDRPRRAAGQADALDELRERDDRDRERDRQPEHDPERTPPPADARSPTAARAAPAARTA